MLVRKLEHGGSMVTATADREVGEDAWRRNECIASAPNSIVSYALVRASTQFPACNTVTCIFVLFPP